MVSVLHWFRKDLRLHDNAALCEALRRGPAAALFVLDAHSQRALGGASQWWLHHSLEKLARDLKALHTPLLLYRGDAKKILPRLVEKFGADIVTANRCYDSLEQEMAELVSLQLHDGYLLHDPGKVRTKGGKPYQVFTPFWNSLRQDLKPPAPLAVPKPQKQTPQLSEQGEALQDWNLLPTKPDWAGGLRENFVPGEQAARQKLARFLDEALVDYKQQRDIPAAPGTSQLSPHLHWGEITPRQIWHAVEHHPARHKMGAETFLKELGWREFSYHLLAQFPDLPQKPLREPYAKFPWSGTSAQLRAWQRGETGYPIVDAGMRQLRQTGWMHNRVRMIAASFLIKDLLIDWREGEKWFWDNLVDADPANNAASWQWVAGCGADAAPFFRIFNPILQGEKFDPKGDYVRRFVPELKNLPPEFIHRPFEAPPILLAEAGVRLGKDYPHPIVDHGEARKKALAALKKIQA